jgi:alkyldihydroxyacetonephosphate synthase
VDTFPDGVAFPEDEAQVRDLLNLARQGGWNLIPYGGGSSVLGHVNPLPGSRPVVTVSMANMNRLLDFSRTNLTATFQAGITGPRIEACLQDRGCTLGHFPQSFEFSTLGGWVATRSSGQQSLGYGSIKAMFKGGLVIAPSGELSLPVVPSSAAGPDLKEVILGSEGRMGFLTRVTVQASPFPERERFHACMIPDWERGLEAVRELAQSRIPLSMIRLSNPLETETSLAMSGHETLVEALKAYLRLRRVGTQGCLLLMGFSGQGRRTRQAVRAALAAVRRTGRGVHLHTSLGRAWHRKRFLAPYLRNALWDRGYAVDTLETAVPWDRVTRTMQDIESGLSAGLEDQGEQVHAFSHLSHVYPTGSSIYTTCVFRLGSSALETLRRWQTLKQAASRAILANQGTISHHHGVGLDHLHDLQPEKGVLGLSAIRSLCAGFDPAGLMNSGKLVSEPRGRAD